MTGDTCGTGMLTPEHLIVSLSIIMGKVHDSLYIYSFITVIISQTFFLSGRVSDLF